MACESAGDCAIPSLQAWWTHPWLVPSHSRGSRRDRLHQVPAVAIRLVLHHVWFLQTLGVQVVVLFEEWPVLRVMLPVVLQDTHLHSTRSIIWLSTNGFRCDCAMCTRSHRHSNHLPSCVKIGCTPPPRDPFFLLARLFPLPHSYQLIDFTPSDCFRSSSLHQFLWQQWS